jgi:lipopolysaccharide transport system permease protein
MKTRLSDASISCIEPAPRFRPLDLPEVWRYRELLYFLVWRDLKVRFKQTTLGVLWIVLRPVLSIAIYTAVFGRLARMPSEGLPYSVFVLAAMLPWTFFSSALTTGTQSLVGSAHLISKIYFPRVLVPIASMGSACIDVVISFGLLAGLMAHHRRLPSASALVTIPLVALIAGGLTVGVILWLSALNVRYRDVGNVVPFSLQIWMYATPIVYPLSAVPERFHWLLILNPLTGVVLAFRAALFGTPIPQLAVGVSAVFAVTLLVSGLFFFRSCERSFADVV